jgi:hypothetical protein
VKDTGKSNKILGNSRPGIRKARFYSCLASYVIKIPQIYPSGLLRSTAMLSLMVLMGIFLMGFDSSNAAGRINRDN